MANRDAALRYAEIKMEIKKLEEEADLIQPVALQFIAEAKGDSQEPVQLKEYPGFNFTISSRKKWTYSDSTTAEIERLAKTKKDEEATGAATYEDGAPFLTFKGPKDK